MLMLPEPLGQRRWPRGSPRDCGWTQDGERSHRAATRPCALSRLMPSVTSVIINHTGGENVPRIYVWSTGRQLVARNVNPRDFEAVSAGDILVRVDGQRRAPPRCPGRPRHRAVVTVDAVRFVLAAASAGNLRLTTVGRARQPARLRRGADSLRCAGDAARAGRSKCHRAPVNSRFDKVVFARDRISLNFGSLFGKKIIDGLLCSRKVFVLIGIHVLIKHDHAAT